MAVDLLRPSRHRRAFCRPTVAGLRHLFPLRQYGACSHKRVVPERIRLDFVG